MKQNNHIVPILPKATMAMTKAPKNILKIVHDMGFCQSIELKILKDHYSSAAMLGKLKNRGFAFQTTVCEKTSYNYIHKEVF